MALKLLNRFGFVILILGIIFLFSGCSQLSDFLNLSEENIIDEKNEYKPIKNGGNALE